MKQIEKPPNWSIAKGLKLFTDKDLRPVINKINEKYLYWDKVKYQKVSQESNPSILWAAVKLSRTIHSKQVRFGKYNFRYNLTDAIQEGLHEFDLHIGGTLGTKNVIPEADKKRYLISSINERQALIIKWLYEEPDLLFSVIEIENRFNISNQTARTDLTRLENKGYLEAIDLNKKAKGFCRSEGFVELLKKELSA